MNSTGPVNVRRYTLYAIIPGLDYYATTKLNKKVSRSENSLWFRDKVTVGLSSLLSWPLFGALPR